jgi:hypothetical protein
MLRFIIVAAALLAASSGAAFAQDDDEEIVVTGSRLVAYESFAVPHVFISRRADFGIVEVEIRNDTRDADARRSEIVDALRRLDAGATRAGMSLAIVDDEIGIVRPYTLAAAEQLMRADGRADTTYLMLRIRTAITQNDTLESIHDRVEQFVANLPKPGRVEMEVDDTDLSMVNLEQYRDGMVQQILAEGRALSAQVGGSQAVAVGGLESQVGFHRTSDLDLTLFLPYTLSVTLAPQS